MPCIARLRKPKKIRLVREDQRTDFIQAPARALHLAEGIWTEVDLEIVVDKRAGARPDVRPAAPTGPEGDAATVGAPQQAACCRWI